MPVARAKKLELVQRRRRIAELYCKGKTQHEIAQELGISQGSVSLDLGKIRAQWREATLEDFTDRLSRELARLDAVERAAWEAFARSQRPLVKGGPPRAGNEKFLGVVARTIETRMRAMGALKGDAPQVNVAVANVDWQQLFNRRAVNDAQCPDPIEQRLKELESLSLMTGEPLSRPDGG